MKRRDDLPDWMWSDALAALDRAERLHRQLFQPRRASTWEPPVDVLETAHEVLIYVALPGVEAHDVDAAIEGAALVVSAGARCRARCARPPSTGWSCRRDGSSGTSPCRPGATAR